MRARGRAVRPSDRLFPTNGAPSLSSAHMNAEPVIDPALPPEPERPDCCAGGCAICVLDAYVEEMRQWREAVAAIEAARQARVVAETGKA
jgi:hypothetical protein